MSRTLLVIIFVLVVVAALMFSMKSGGPPVLGGASAMTGPPIGAADDHTHEIDLSQMSEAVGSE